jgi:hypothetical protein
MARTWTRVAVAILLMTAAVVVGGAGYGTPRASADAPAEVVERSRILERPDGTVVIASALIDARLVDPEAAMDAILPGSRRDVDGGASAAYKLWVKWATNDLPLEVRYNPAGEPPGVDGLAAMRFAVDTWNAVPGQGFRFVDGGTTSVGNTACSNSQYPDGVNALTWDGYRPGVLGTTCAIAGRSTIDGQIQIIEGDISFSPALHFSTSATTPAGTYDFMSNILHELGHLLGLDHSTAAGSVMTKTLGTGVQRRTPTADDIKGMRALYGDGSPDPGPTPVRPPLPVKVAVIGVSRDP